MAKKNLYIIGVLILLIFSFLLLTNKIFKDKRVVFDLNNLAASVNLTDTDVSSLGTWGIGNGTQFVIDRYKPAIDGYFLTFKWKDIEQTKDNFVWTDFDAKFKNSIENNNFNVGFMVYVSFNAPEYVYCSNADAANCVPCPDNPAATNCVPKVYTDTADPNQSNFFPYYLNGYYTERYYNMLNKVAEHIAGYPQSWKDRLSHWMSAEGSTGDEGPYKGNPINPLTGARETKYDISDSQWDTYKQNVWTMLYNLNKAINPNLEILINSGNSAENFDWVYNNLPCAWSKAGILSHGYSFPGEINEYNRYQKVKNSPANCNRSRGEFQNAFDFNTWKKAPLSNTYMMTLSALTMGLDILNLADGSTTRNTSDLTVYDTFTKYAGIRDAKYTKKAFVYLRDVPDMGDTVRFPEATFGPVVPTAKKASYDAAIKSIQNNSSYGPSLKDELISARKESYFNTSRKDAILNSAQFSTNPAVINKPKFVVVPNKTLFEASNPFPNIDQSYAITDHDFGIDMLPDNYFKFITQINPNQTSIGQWRIGSTDSKFGRYARSFDAAANKKQMTFNIDDTLDNSRRNAKRLKISVTYFDSGSGVWGLKYAYNGSTGSGQNTWTKALTNTGKWITVSNVIPDVELANKIDDSTTGTIGDGDFALTYESGANTIFSLIEVEIVSDSTTPTITNPTSTANTPPVVNAGTDKTITLPTNSVTLTGSATDNGTIASYAWTKVSGGAAIFSNTSTSTTTISGLVQGSYVFRLTATDTLGLTGSDTVTVTVNPAGNIAPTVSLSSPANNATYTSPATITLTANANDTDGTITKVDFYNGTTLLNSDTSSPYSYSWTNVVSGSYTVSAKATDNSGTVTSSSQIGIVVTNVSSNTPPTISINKPVDGADFDTSESISIEVTAADSDGSVTKVEFYSDGAKIGEDTSNPYSLVWSTSTEGSYTLSAKATDNSANTTTAGNVRIDITKPASGGGGGSSSGGGGGSSSGNTYDYCNNLSDIQYTIPTGYTGLSDGSCMVVTNSGGTGTTPAYIPPFFPFNLYYGITDTLVRELQKYLNSRGFTVATSGAGAPGFESSYFGTRTRDALSLFQKANNISPSAGYFGPVTRGVVNNDLGGTTAVTPPVNISTGTKPQFTYNLFFGMSDPLVADLQRYLNSIGFTVATSGAGAPGFESSYFGQRTKEALARFQVSNGISPAEGYFGPITRALVNSR